MSKGVKVSKTFDELSEVDRMVGYLYKKNPELEHSKFGYAYKRFSDKNYMSLFQEFMGKIKDVQIDNALENEQTKEILVDKDPMNQRGFKYSKEGLKKVIKDEEKITDTFNKKVIEIEPFFCPKDSIPKKLEDWQIDLLKGLIIE